MVAPALGNRSIRTENAAREQEHGTEPARVERDGRPGRDGVVVNQRLDLHALLEPAVGTLSTLRDELRQLEQLVAVIDLLEPEQVLEPAIVHELVERGRPPVVRARRSVDPSTTVFLAGNVIPS